MIEIIQAGFNALKSAGDLAKGLINLKTEAAKNQAVIDIQRHVLDAQRALMDADSLHASDLARMADLEKEIARSKDWQTERGRYELKRYQPGTLAYALKPSMASGEPPHKLCAHCYQKGEKSILQATGRLEVGRRVSVCPSCQTEFPMGEEMPDGTAEDKTSGVTAFTFKTSYDPYHDLDP